MDSDQGKLFIGGISWETTEDKLRDHFGKYGDVTHAVIMRDKITGRPRGFGFVVFADPTLLDAVLLDQHNIDGRIVEAKRALSREEQQTTVRSGNNNPSKVSGGAAAGGNMRTKKIFVGGLPATLTEDTFRQFFQQYGNVTDVVVMYDQNTQRPRGFGFITFDSEDAVERVLHKTFHELGGKMVEVKRALPKDANPNSGGNRSGGGGYQSYSGSGGSDGSYDNRMDSNRYMQPPGAAGGYPGYGSSGYNGPQGYGYGTGSNNVGYGGYGPGGYGGTAAGYGAPGGGYANPSGPPGGYMGPSGGYGGPRGPWNSHGPTGYGSAGYGGNASYGGAPSWNSSAGTVGAPTDQSPGGPIGYGSQGYGYGGYGGVEGPYGGQGGYGGSRGSGGPTNSHSVGPEMGGGPGYVSGGYGDSNGSSGYSGGWKHESSQGPYGTGQTNGASGGPASYATGYSRQPQQQ